VNKIGPVERVVNRVYWPTNPVCTEEQVTYTRYWVHGQILVGGTIQDVKDWEHLRDDYGCQFTLSVESERDDVNRLGAMPTKHIWDPFEDRGVLEESTLNRVIYWSLEPLRSGMSIYVHCQMGGSRSPSIAYALLRGIFGKSKDEALAAIRVSRPDFGANGSPIVPAYLASVEAYLAKVAI
jgi:protein-tyrosine phosphatase